jgi:hypothetical protein
MGGIKLVHYWYPLCSTQKKKIKDKIQHHKSVKMLV